MGLGCFWRSIFCERFNFFQYLIVRYNFKTGEILNEWMDRGIFDIKKINRKIL